MDDQKLEANFGYVRSCFLLKHHQSYQLLYIILQNIVKNVITYFPFHDDAFSESRIKSITYGKTLNKLPFHKNVTKKISLSHILV